MGRPLTVRQQKVYDFIHDKISNRGYGPTVREIGEFLGIRSPNGVICHLRALERKGMISRTANKSRAIELKHRAKVDNSPGLLMRGKVDNGSCNLFEAPQTLDVLNALRHPERFLLQYNGDALLDSAIADGDILVIGQRSEGSDGCVELVRDAAGALHVRPAVAARVVPTASSTFVGGPAKAASAFEVVGVVVGIIRSLPTFHAPARETAAAQLSNSSPLNSAHSAHELSHILGPSERDKMLGHAPNVPNGMHAGSNRSNSRLG